MILYASMKRVLWKMMKLILIPNLVRLMCGNEVLLGVTKRVSHLYTENDSQKNEKDKTIFGLI